MRCDSAAGRAKWAELQRVWETAPLKHTLDGVQVRISGYVVPLAGDMHGLTELLLVPYFDACIHSPPPPANQVVWVRLRTPASGLAPPAIGPRDQWLCDS